MRSLDQQHQYLLGTCQKVQTLAYPSSPDLLNQKLEAQSPAIHPLTRYPGDLDLLRREYVLCHLSIYLHPLSAICLYDIFVLFKQPPSNKNKAEGKVEKFSKRIV